MSEWPRIIANVRVSPDRIWVSLRHPPTAKLGDAGSAEFFFTREECAALIAAITDAAKEIRS